MTRKRRSQAVNSLVFGMALGAWIALGVVLHGVLAHQNNLRYLQDLSDQLIRRIEKSVDYVVIAGSELLISGMTECGGAAEAVLRNMALGTANTPNIFLVTPSSQCASFEDYGVYLPPSTERREWVMARNPAYRVGPMEGPQGRLLGVSWGYGSDLELVVAIDVSSLLFDTLQFDLRSGGHIALNTDRTGITEFSGETALGSDVVTWPTFASQGERYPLHSEIRIDPDVLAAWRREIATEVSVLWTAAGLFVAGLASIVVARGRDTMLSEVLDALDHQEFVPFFQPIVDIDSGTIVGCEALARWIKPDGTSCPPGKFIPILESKGLNGLLFQALIKQAAESFGYELDQRPEFYISFNVTPDQLQERDSAETLLSIVERSGLKTEQVCLEITERQELAAQEQVANALNFLSAAGMRIAIDDAGTGHNGLSAIQSLRATTLKIDKFFVDTLVEESRAKVMVELLVSVASDFGMKTIAEGVEHSAQVDALREAGVDAIQGFLVSEPLPAQEFLFALNTKWEDGGSAVQNLYATRDTLTASQPA